MAEANKSAENLHVIDRPMDRTEAQHRNFQHPYPYIGKHCTCVEANQMTFCRAVKGREEVKGREQRRRDTVNPHHPVPDHILRPPNDCTFCLPDVNPDQQMHDSESIVRMIAAC